MTTTMVLIVRMKVLLLFVISLLFVSCSGADQIRKNDQEVLTQEKKESITKNFKKLDRFGGKYNNLKTMFEVLPDEEGEIIFLGNSITEYCQWHELFGNPKVKNRGIGGDNTEGVLSRVDEVVSSRPSKIFLMIGINDISAGYKAPKIADTIEKIVENILQKSPKTLLYLQSVLPVNYKLFGNKIDNKDVMKLNELIQSIASKRNLTYIDLFSNLKSSDNQLDENYTYDGLHLNGNGYLIWKEIIKDLVH
ncbi:MAG: GDSL-type esterase/lipase family protein [Ignavibacteria bacterium]|nr:GDSL-type esterase/lipase family protein [Ignavibacteria bacterium]